MDLVNKQLETLRKYSTPFGTAWYFMNFFWRMFGVKTVGEKVYGDSLREFKVWTNFFVFGGKLFFNAFLRNYVTFHKNYDFSGYCF